MHVYLYSPTEFKSLCLGNGATQQWVFPPLTEVGNQDNPSQAVLVRFLLL